MKFLVLFMSVTMSIAFQAKTRKVMTLDGVHYLGILLKRNIDTLPLQN